MNEMKNGNGNGKVLSLEEAIRRFVRPGMALHLAGGIGGPGAAVCQIIREYYGTHPDFRVIQSTVTGHSINLIHCGLVKKLIFSACMEISQSAHPSKVIQNAYAEKRIEMENWSLLTLQQRLMAGALGVGFMPTRSLLGSSLADDNQDSFTLMDDPFNPDGKVGILKALNPDLSIVHGCVSDIYGNTIPSVPNGDDIWGSLASTEGVVVTVEQIVSSDVIRKYASLVKIPSFTVRAVCLAPLGVHPYAFPNPVRDAAESYETDIEFLEDLHQVFSDSERLDKWVNTWVLSCPTHIQYLEKLGDARISRLKESACSPSTPTSDEEKAGRRSIRLNDGYTREEMVFIAASREIIDSVIESGYKTMLAGAGSWSLAARLAHQSLKSRGFELELIMGNGQIAYTPPPGKSSTQTVFGIWSSRMLTDTITTHGFFVGGKNSQCLSVLGAGQVDKYGNINSSRTAGGDFLVGTGGANDAANANEVILILHQFRKRFVETLPYITATGVKVSKVISTMGVFKKAPGKDDLILTSCLPDPATSSLEDTIQKIQKECGWPLQRAREISFLPEPTADELLSLRSLLNCH